MVIKIHNVTKWSELKPGEALTLRGQEGQPRKVRVELNCVAPTRVDLVEGDGSVWFLGTVEGFEVVEFSTEAAEAQLVPTSEGEVWFFTNDGDQIAVDRSMEAESFTKVMQRRVRNPQLEAIEWKMRQNMERRFAQQAAELEALRAAQAKLAGADPVTGEVEGGEADVGGGASDGAAGGGTPAAGGTADGASEGADGNAGT